MGGMTTITLKFQIRRRQEIDEVLGKVKVMEQKAVNRMLRNKKTALSSVHSSLYYPLREQFPNLHSHWVKSALKTATGIVHQFKKRKRKGKAKYPKLKKPFVSLSPELFKVSWKGKGLKVTISKTAHDLDPIVLDFRVQSSRYREVLEKWISGEAKMGQITLTSTSISIPFQLPSVPSYQPFTVIGIDSNENSLDYFEPLKGVLDSIDISEVSRINRDYDRRIRRGRKE